ncbi:MAG: COX15/CtaA family protein [Pseudomonadota bacterium]|nr:MAG: COX15/CtaA family protein [Pseudomonadota bacterium]
MLGKSQSAKFMRMALWATLLALAAVVFNAYARLSEAGLGCPDWPGCYGMLFAPVTAQDLPSATAPEEERRLAKKRAAQETMQRFIAGALGLVLIRLFVLGWKLKKRKRSQQVLIPLATMVLTFALAFIGFLTFEHRYMPVVLMMQILGGFATVALLWWIVLREQRFWRALPASPVTRRVWPRAVFALGLVAGQIALGGWSMVNYAGLACPDFPTCQATWWPEMDFAVAFTLWQEMGLNYEGRMLNLPAATAIHMAHRAGALITLLYVGWLAFYVVRVGGEDRLCRYGLLVLLVLSFAAVLGVMQVLMRLPLAVAVAHSLAAVLLLLSVVTLIHVVRAPALAR